jgi:hypothetical protein
MTPALRLQFECAVAELRDRDNGTPIADRVVSGQMKREDRSLYPPRAEREVSPMPFAIATTLPRVVPSAIIALYVLLHANWVPRENRRKIRSLNPREISEPDQGIRLGSVATRKIDIVAKRLCRRRNCPFGHRQVHVAMHTHKDQSPDRRDSF